MSLSPEGDRTANGEEVTDFLTLFFDKSENQPALSRSEGSNLPGSLPSFNVSRVRRWFHCDPANARTVERRLGKRRNVLLRNWVTRRIRIYSLYGRENVKYRCVREIKWISIESRMECTSGVKISNLIGRRKLYLPKSLLMIRKLM